MAAFFRYVVLINSQFGLTETKNSVHLHPQKFGV
jgi:hypothetical protein